jgi:hypothetical protein
MRKGEDYPSKTCIMEEVVWESLGGIGGVVYAMRI